MFDSQLRPIYDGKVLANQTAMDNPVVKATLFEMSKRNFEPQRLNHVYTKRNRSLNVY